MTGDIISAVLLALLLVAAAFLLFRGRRSTAGAGAATDELIIDRGGRRLVMAPGGHPVVQWGAADAIAAAVFVFVATLFLQVAGFAVLSIAMGILSPGFDIEGFLDSAPGSSLFTVLQWIATIAVPLMFLRARGYYFDHVTFGFRGVERVGRTIGLWLLVMFIFYLLLPTLYTMLIEYLDPSRLPEQDIVEPFGLTWSGFAVAIIVVVIATPVIEEFLFRGIIHQGLERRFGFVAGALVSSLIFALFHVDYRLFPPIFFLGFGFALLLHRTGSIWPPIAGHFIVNLTGVMGQFWDLFGS